MSRINQICKLFFQNDYPKDLQSRFFLWFAAPVSTEQKEEALQQLWDDIEVPFDSATESSYLKVYERIYQPERRNFFVGFRRIAAALLIPILSAGATYLYMKYKEVPDTELLECFVPDGEIRQILLPDHSTVTINSGSTLIYPKSFNGKTRKIYLSGEAKFMVQKDPEKPFIVKTRDMETEALGTVFNVSSYADNLLTISTLISGKVRVGVKSNSENFILSPSEQIVYNHESKFAVKKNARIDYVLAWERGQLVFQEASLQEIFRQLEHRYKVSIYLNAKKLNQERLTVKFMHKETLEDILKTLQQLVPGFKYKIEASKIFIY